MVKVPIYPSILTYKCVRGGAWPEIPAGVIIPVVRVTVIRLGVRFGYACPSPMGIGLPP